jgi:hypothetical protein
MLQSWRNRKRSVQICNLQTDFGRVTRIYLIRGVQAFKSSPCHPTNIKSQALATRRDKIFRPILSDRLWLKEKFANKLYAAPYNEQAHLLGFLEFVQGNIDRNG